MLLRGEDGSEMELAIVGYQFPESQLDPWDSNSLLVSLRVVTPAGTWEVIDPCLTTWEAGELVRWLAALAASGVAWRPFVLAEPNLTFTATSGASADRLRVRARFELERRPPWARLAASAGDLDVELDVERAQLGVAASSLAGDLSSFPERGDRPL